MTTEGAPGTIEPVESTTSPVARPHKGLKILATGLAIAAGATYLVHNQGKVDGLEGQVQALQTTNGQLSQEFAHSNAAISRLLSQPPDYVDGAQFRAPIKPTSGHVPSSIVRLHEGAALELLERPKGSTSAWQPTCSADKVSLGGIYYVLSANHCFIPQEGIPIKGGGNAPALPAAANITSRITVEYAVAEPAKSPDLNNQLYHGWDIEAKVDGVAVDESGDADWGMLSVVPTPSFNDLPAIPLDHEQTEQSNKSYNGPDALGPVGEPVSLYSMPQNTDYLPVKETGTYLGRIDDYPYDNSYYYDVVGIDPSNVGEDSCDYGSSGSVSVLANGNVTGPLSYRDNLGYGPDDYFYSPDSSVTDEEDRLDVEKDLDHNLDDFSTLCFYSVPEGAKSSNSQNTTTYSQLAKALEDNATLKPTNPPLGL